jgi:uncharacterized membrane protein YjdF
MSRTLYLSILCAVYAVLWTTAAIAPLHRFDWLLENALVALAIIVLVGTYRLFPRSRVSYTLIFPFMSLRTLSARITRMLRFPTARTAGLIDRGAFRRAMSRQAAWHRSTHRGERASA